MSPAVPKAACPAARRPRSPKPAVPAYGGNVRWARRTCPDLCASPWASLDHNPDPLNGIRTGAIGGPAADPRCAGVQGGLQQRDNTEAVVGPGVGRVSKPALALRQIRGASHPQTRTDTP